MRFLLGIHEHCNALQLLYRLSQDRLLEMTLYLKIYMARVEEFHRDMLLTALRLFNETLEVQKNALVSSASTLGI
jgi:hypothetical protein